MSSSRTPTQDPARSATRDPSTQKRSLQDLRHRYGRGEITRREFISRALALGVGLGAAEAVLGASRPVAPAAAAAPAGAPTPEAAGARGGTLRACLGGEPPTLDVQWSTATWTRDVGWHIVESLFTWDASYNTIPHLAETYEVSKDGLTHTLRLRKSVPFHNGKEMGAEDVEASLRRWARLSGNAKDLFAHLQALTTPDKYTLVFKLKGPYGIFASSLSLLGQGAGIYPKEVIEEAGTGQIKRHVGTGPYRFVEHQKDRFIRLARFDNYVARGERADGFGGKKHAFFDEIRFIPTPDQSVRVAGVQAGEFDYADNINTDQYALLKDSPQVRTIVVTLGRVLCAFFNLKSPVTADVKVRQAALAALDMEPILKAGWGSPEFYQLNPSLMWKGTPWHTEAAKEFYSQKNIPRAKQLLKESGYKGEPIRWMTTREFPWLYQESVVASQAMQAAGLNVKLDLTDWATLVTRRAKPEGWEIFGGSPTFVPDPLLASWNQPGVFPGWWDSPAAKGLRKIQVEKTDFKERFAAWEAFQRVYYEEVPFLKFGDANELLITGPKVRGVLRSATLSFWNAWFAK